MYLRERGHEIFCLFIFPGVLTESWIRKQSSELELMPVWDAGTTPGSLACCTMMPAPGITISMPSLLQNCLVSFS